MILILILINRNKYFSIMFVFGFFNIVLLVMIFYCYRVSIVVYLVFRCVMGSISIIDIGIVICWCFGGWEVVVFWVVVVRGLFCFCCYF